MADSSGFAADLEGAQFCATREDDDDDFFRVLMPGPINDTINLYTDIYKRRIGTFHEGFFSNRSQTIGVDRPEQASVSGRQTGVWEFEWCRDCHGPQQLAEM